MKSVLTWNLILILLLFVMVGVGGGTRLTGSGLSMVDWKPLMGAIPPLSQSAWQEKFELYKGSPQYQKVNTGMSLPEFRKIFYWEYFHRLLGRLIGLVFFFPFLVFWFRGILRGRLALKYFMAFALGGFQGLLGWYMVKSGLVYEPRVSHYRLASHLSLAFLVTVYLVWIYLSEKYRRSELRKPDLFLMVCGALLVLCCVQVVWGAFVAGLRAGFIMNTFPTMGGAWIPDGLWILHPTWRNLFDNPLLVQWIHRLVAWVILFLSVVIFWRSFKESLSDRQRQFVSLSVALIFFQFTLGVATLLLAVPVWLGVFHQVNALALICSLFTTVYFLRERARV